MKRSLLYTRTGDSGKTSLVSGNRVDKTHPRIEAYGTLDELNSHIGLLSSQDLPDPDLTHPMLDFIQHKLFDIGAYLATDPSAMPDGMALPASATACDVERIEKMIDVIDGKLPPLRRFVLPGGTQPSAMAQVARTVCRRAERRLLALAAETEVDADTLRFVNRLSDFLFAMARFCNVAAGHREIFWEKNC